MNPHDRPFPSIIVDGSQARKTASNRRLRYEEATLRRDLAGYADYQSRVRPRILPGVL